MARRAVLEPEGPEAVPTRTERQEADVGEKRRERSLVWFRRLGKAEAANCPGSHCGSRHRSHEHPADPAMNLSSLCGYQRDPENAQRDGACQHMDEQQAFEKH